jgi:2-polyprenyl-6-methoxyphenol hydroxylase-like FAD-dependent oxidoreductase
VGYKAIIIGAGIGGLSAALALQGIGYEVAVYERMPQFKAVGAGISLWPNAIKCLDQLGVGQRVRAMGMREGSGGIHTSKGKTLFSASVYETEQHFGAPTIVIHRADLSQILADAYSGALYLGKTFTHYQDDSEAVTAHFADGEQATGDLLVCADGIHSSLRQSWFPGSAPIYAGYSAWRAVVPFDHARVGELWGEFLGRGARFGITPLSDGRIYWYATQNLPEGSRIVADALQNYLLAIFGDWVAPIPDLLRASPKDAILQNDIYDIEPLSHWVRGRAALLGDAAHAMTPNLGQGGCQALEDAIVLAKCLKGAPSIEAALKCYQERRLARANQLILTSRRLGKILAPNNALLCSLRDLALRLIPSSLQMRNLENIVGYEV